MKAGVRTYATLLAACIVLLTLGCLPPAGEVRFTAADGHQNPLRVSRVEGSRNYRLAPADGIAATGAVHLRKPVMVAANQALYLQYRATVAGATVSVLSGRGQEVARYRLLAGGQAPVRRYLPLPPGPFWGVRLWTEERVGQLDLTGAGVSRSPSGVAMVDGVLHVGVDTLLPRGTRVDAGGLIELAVRLQTVRSTPQPGRGLVIRSSFTPDSASGTGELLLEVSGGADAAKRAVVEVLLSEGERLVHLHELVLGFVPTGVQALSHTGGGVRFVELRRTEFDTGPLPADLESILSYPQSAWRTEDWEVFRWTAFPRVLIFDTASYGIQEMLFRRLAYFVEKAGFRGRVHSDAKLAGRYGYNAHDYAADDIARFFTEAHRDRVALNDAEIKLRDLLAAEGMIRATDGAWEAGSGAVLSISRASPPTLRKLLLRHEAAHGLYFVQPEYRRWVTSLWQEIGEPARVAWRAYLSTLGYDSSWEKLMMNEFQAYLAQHEQASLSYYFGRLVPDRIRRVLPAEEVAAAWFQTGSEVILNQHQGVDRALRAVAGMRAGRLATVLLRQ